MSCLEKMGDYVQPPKTLSAYKKKIYKPPIIPIESETTYKKSYLANKYFEMNKIFKKCENVEITGIMDFNTTNQMSYMENFKKRTEKIFPRNHLKCEGSNNFVSSYLDSYFNPGLVKTLPIMPKRGKLQYPEQMEFRTIMTESFQNPGKLEKDIFKAKCGFKSEAKIENLTTNRLSYQKLNYQKRTNCRPKYCPILASLNFEENTIYKSSYEPPGCYL